jgi:hypothetical protein
MQFSAEHYYRAACERIVEAGVLYDKQRHGLSMYVAGLSVECLLRAFRFRKDPVFDTRHDLRIFFRESGILRLHEDRLEQQGFEPERALQTIAEFRAAHDTVVRLWRNDGRFAAEAHLRGLQPRFIHHPHFRLTRNHHATCGRNPQIIHHPARDHAVLVTYSGTTRPRR